MFSLIFLLFIALGVGFGLVVEKLSAINRRLDLLEGKKSAAPSVPPPIPSAPRAGPVAPPPVTASVPAAPRVASLNWESFVGVKLFAFLGGLAFFLGVVFFVKYAFEKNLIPPAARVSIGGAVGVALVILGAFLTRKRFQVPAQSLCATGFLVLYADIYAAHSLYALISLGVASALMCAVTASALVLAALLETQSVVWLAALGGFLTPPLFWTKHDRPLVIFGYVALLNFALALAATMKRWPHFVFVAACGTIAIELAWAANFFGPATADTGRLALLLLEAEFLLICAALAKWRERERWSIAAVGTLALVTILFTLAASYAQDRYRADYAFPLLFFANAGLLGAAAARRGAANLLAILIVAALAFTWMAEWAWHDAIFHVPLISFGLIWYLAILLLFSVAPHFYEQDHFWPWAIAAIAGPLQFWFVYRLVALSHPDGWIFLLPLGFSILPAANALHLNRRLAIPLASGDSRLAVQVAAFLFFISLVLPVQFEREWITLGWAVEAVALLLVFRVIPNPQLRIGSLVLLGAAFVRLALNPAVLKYHPLSGVPIWNWFLYAYGMSALCFFAAARLYAGAEQSRFVIAARASLYVLGTIVLFLLLNIEIADYFSIGPTLTFSFSGNFATDMSYSIGWAVFAFALLLVGMMRHARGARIAALALLSATLLKLFLHDLDQLNQLYRVGALLGVATVAIIASFIYQRFLVPARSHEQT